MRKLLVVFGLCLGLGVAAAEPIPVSELAALDELPGVEIPVSVNMPGTKLSSVIKSMAAAGPFKVTFEGNVGDVRVEARSDKSTMKDVLVDLAVRYRLSYEVTADRQLVVKKRLSTGSGELPSGE